MKYLRTRPTDALPILSLTLATTALVILGYQPANAAEASASDTYASEGCASHVEFDNTHSGLSVIQVSNRYDTYGEFIGSQGNNQRRAYNACWTNEREIIVEFSYNSGDSVDWYTRAI